MQGPGKLIGKLLGIRCARSRPEPELLMVEAMEPRVLFSADLLPTDDDGLLQSGYVQSLDAQSSEAVQPEATQASQSPVTREQIRHELIVVDAGVDNAEALINRLLQENAAHQSLQVLYINGDEDGITQISDYLAGSAPVDAIHLISHGEAGSLQLGSGNLDQQVVAERADEIRAWSSALTDDADLLLYGCNLAASDAGLALLDQLAALTGTDIAASDDLTGAGSAGGDWDLEIKVGQVEASTNTVHVAGAVLKGTLNLTPAGGEIWVNTTNNAGDQQLTPYGGGTVAMDASGNFVVVWNDLSTGDVYFQRFDTAGNALGSNVRANTTTVSTQQEVGVAMDNSGNFVVVWESANQDGSGTGIYAQRYNASGVAQGSEFLVNSITAGNQTLPAIAMAANTGDFVIAWADGTADGSGRGVFAQRYNASGVAQGGQFQVNTTTANDQEYPSVAMSPDGDFLITWDSDNGGTFFDVMGQRYNATGTPQDGQFQVNTYTTSSQWNSSVAMDDAGNFVVAWESDGQDPGGNTGIYAQRYNASGVAQGSVFRVNTTTIGNQIIPSLAMSQNGDFVIAWSDISANDGSGRGVYAQRYNADGTTAGVETVVNTTTFNDQGLATAAYRGGNIVIAWHGNGPGDSTGIFAQRYTTPDPIISFGEGTNTFTEGGSTIVIDSLATATDADSADFDGGQLLVDVTVNGQGGDRIEIRNEGTGAGQVGVSGSTVTYAGTTIGTFTGSGAPLAITFNANADITAVQAVMRNITFRNIDVDPTTVDRTVRFRLSDGDGGNSNEITKTIAVTGDATLVVTTTAINVDGNTSSIDALLANRGADGQIDLQEAIEATNNEAGLNQIDFNIAAPLVGGAHTINLTSALPFIYDQITINGASEPDFAGTPVIELNGSATPIANENAGLRLYGGSSGSTIRSLTISGFGDDGIIVWDSSNNLIVGNYIGLDVSGTATRSNVQDGIVIGGNSDSNQIGATGANDGNVISGNSLAGIDILGPDTDNNIILNNRIGTNAAGTAANGNGNQGILVQGGATGTVIGNGSAAGRNIIAANGSDNIRIAASDSTTIRGNYIGTDVSGTLDLDGTVAASSRNGISITNSDGTTVGGTGAGDGNLISGNNWYGIDITSDSTNTTVVGNLIGTDAAGTSALPNAEGGIAMSSGASNNIIGGNTAAHRNIISGNFGRGIYVSGATTANNQILGNYIGADINGDPLGNGTHGIDFVNSASDNLVGGTGTSDGNLIANSTFDGIVAISGTNRNSFLGNVILDNSGQGIDLDGEGSTDNDADDVDAGANELLNFPLLLSAGNSAATTVVRGSLNSVASRTYRLEFFSLPPADADPSGNGEAAVYVGSTQVTTDGSGNATFDVTLPVTTTPGHLLTATSTHIENAGQVGVSDLAAYGATSEFAENVSIQDALPVIDLDADNSSGSTGSDFNTTFSENAGPVTLSDADASLQDATSSTLDSLTVTLTNLLDGAAEVLAADTSGTSITANYVSATGVLTLSGTDSVANYQQVLRTVTYDNASSPPDLTARVITFVANDGANDSLTATTTVTMYALDTTVVVDTTNDLVDGNTSSIAALEADKGADGFVSLREAILAANNQSGQDSITFGIAGAGSQVISLTSPLPVVTDAVTIDGTTQAGWVQQTFMPVVIDGNDAANALTLGIGSDGSQIRGLVIRDVSTGIYVQSNGHLIAGNWFGQFNSDGSDAGIGEAITSYGITTDSGADGSTVGGTTAADRNVITTEGNGSDGIYLYAADSWNISGNYFGTDTTGSALLASTTNPGTGFITTNSSELNTIGGSTDAHRNVFAGLDAGIEFQDFAAQPNYVYNNWIGLGADGSTVLGSLDSGINILDTHQVIVGGVDLGNVIVGSGFAGIYFWDNNDNVIQGNYIGQDESGSIVAGNSYGIYADGTINYTIGGIVAGEGNTITASTNDGVAVVVATSSGTIRGNSIFGNTGLGIDLNNDGVSANDAGDTDPGPNTMQNWAAINSTQVNPAAFFYDIDTTTLAASTYTVDFYSSTDFDGGQVEGATYLGTITGIGGGSGSVTGSIAGTSLAVGEYVTLVTTSSSGNSSEFSTYATATLAPNTSPAFSALNNTPTYVENGTPVILDGDVSLTDAELDALNSGNGNYAGASISVARNGGANSDDVLSFNDGNGISLSGASLIKNGQTIAAFDTSSIAGELVITFTDVNGEVPTSIDVDNILRQITYANISDTPPASVSLDWTADDGNTGIQGSGGALTATGSLTVSITQVNDPPQHIRLDTQGSTVAGLTGASAVAAADFDGDGDIDIVAGSLDAASDQSIVWYQNDGSENFTPFVVTTAGMTADGIRALEAVDLDGDSDQDIVSVSAVDNRTSWWQNDGAGNFTQVIVSTALQSPRAVTAADFDGDGDIDLITGGASGAGDTIHWLENDGAENFTARTVTTVGTTNFVTAVEVADIDGDSDLDIVAAAFVQDAFMWFEHQGGGTFATHTIASGVSADGAADIAVGDFDSDGYIDVAGVAQNANTLAVYTNTGGGSFGAGPAWSVSANGARSLAAADLDGNGTSDLIVGAITDQTITGYLNQGSSTPGFDAYSISTSSQYPLDLTVTDMDGDGDVDILEAAYTPDDEVRWYENRGDFNTAAETAEDTPLVFSPGSGNGIIVADPDAGGNAMRVSLTGTSGTVTLSQTTGLSFSTGSGTGEAVMVFDGTRDDINAALDGLVFLPTADFTGVASLQIVTDDLGNSGGGSQTDDDTVLITVTPVNDAPVNTVPVSATVAEETPGAISGISISDVDDQGNNLSSRLQVSNGVLNVTLSGSASISAGSNGSADLTILGTESDINATLASLTYTGNTNVTGVNADTLTVTTDDLGNTGSPGALQDTDTVQIDITAVDDAPTVGVNTGTSVNEGATVVITNTMLRLDDADTATTGRVYTVSTLPVNGTIRLNASALGVGGTFTQDDIDNNRVDYVHNDSETNADSFQFTYGDATTSGLGPVTFSLTINPVNDNDPVITSDGGGTNAAVNVSENTTAITSVVATDADLPAQSITYSISGGVDAAFFSINPTTGALTFNAAPDFETPADSDTNNTYEVSVQASDGTRTDTQAITVSVTDANEAPAGADNTVSTAEDVPYTFATGDFGFTDIDAGDSLANVRIDTLPGAGALTLAGAPITAGQIVAAGAITAGDLVYTPPADANGAALTTFTFSVQDTGGLFDPAPNTITVDVSAVNDAPVNTAPASATVTEEAATAIAGISIADTDAAGNNLTTRLQVTAGVLDVTLAGSATISAGANSSNDLTILGTAADINATLTSLTYTGNTNVTGVNADTLTVTTDDQGNTGSPGALQDTDTVQIDITALDDAPTLGVNTGTSVNEGASVVITNTMLRLDDVDTATTGRVYTVSVLPTNGTLRLNAGALGIGGTFTQDDIDNNRVDYVHNDSETNADSFQFTYGDATTTGLGPETFSLTITPVNDNNPIITSDGGGATAVALVDENNTAVTTVVATDADLPAQTITYSINGGVDAAFFSINPTTGALTFNAAPDFESPADTGADNTYVVTMQASDGTNIDTQTITVGINDVNEAPAGTDNTVSTVEDTPYTFATGDFGFTDLDAGDSLANVRIDTLPGAGALTLAGAPVSAGQVIAAAAITAGDLVYTPPADANGAGLTTFTFSVQDSGGLFDAAPNTITVDVTAVDDAPTLGVNTGTSVNEGGTVVITNTMLRLDDVDTATTGRIYTVSTLPVNGSIRLNASALGVGGTFTQDDIDNNRVDYVHNDSETSADSFQYTYGDATTSGLGPVTFNLTINPVNDNDPVITSDGGGATAAVNVAENTTAVTTVSATDTDLPAQTITYSISGGVDAALFTINPTTGALTFNAAPDFEAPADNDTNNTYEVSVQASDGTRTDTQAISVTVTDANEAPAGADNNVSTAEDTPYAFTTADFGFTDVDAGDSLANVRIDTLPGAGALTLAGVPVTSGQVIAAGAITSGDLVYTPPADANGTGLTTFTFSVQDSGGLFDAAPNTITVDVSAVNDAPVNTVPASATVTEETATAIAGISIADPDAAGNNLTTRLQVTAGVLDVTLVGSSTISAGANSSNDLTILGTAADINATLASLTYTGNTNVTGVNADTLTVTTDDLGNTGSPGALQDTDTVQIDITAVDDAPTIGVNTGTSVNEGSTVIITNTMLRLDDVDTAAAGRVYTVSTLPVNGTIRLNAGALGIGGAFTQDDIDNNRVDYVHNDSETSADSFQFTYGDATTTGLGPVTFSLTINPVNDNDPVITSDGGSASASVTVAENTTAVTAVTATDADQPAQTITYSISGGVDAAFFSINPTTGALTFNAAPDFETPADSDTNNTYEVSVQASDGTRTDSQAITVSATDANEAPSGADNTVATAEDVPYTFATGDFGFTDVDAGDSLSNVRIDTLPASGALTLAGVPVTSGQVIAAGAITSGDLVYTPPVDVNGTGLTTFTFSVQDSGGLFDAAPNTITVDVIAVNDTPVVTGPGSAYAALEQTNLNIHGTGFTVTDVDAATGTMTATLTVGEGNVALAAGDSGVSITANNASSVSFTGTLAQIDNLLTGASTGTIVYNSASDTPSASTTITLTVNDGGNTGTDPDLTADGSSEQDSAVQTINITPVDDAPTVGVNTGTSVNEGGTVVITNTMLRLDDVDTATAGRVYTVSTLPVNGSIRLNAGALGVDGTFTQDDIDNNRVDYVHNDSETAADSFQFTYGDATTSGLGPVTFNLTVNPVNDNDPVITSDGGGATASVNVSENTTAVTTGTATDADLPAQTLTWSIVPVGSGGAADAALFSINPSTGVLSFNAAPDFEAPADAGANNVYDVTVQVSDGTRIDTQLVSVTVTDTNEFAVGAVTDSDPAANQVAENATTGTAVGITGFASDADGTDTVTYSLADGLGVPQDAAGRFAIDPVSGVVTVANGTLLDAEVTGSHAITVRADSSDGSIALQTYTIAVTDLNDSAPVVTPTLVFTVAENSPAGTPVGTVTASDADSVGSLQNWTIVGGTGAAAFSIDAATGQVSVSDPAGLDFEASPALDLLVTVSDGAQTSNPEAVLINLLDVNERPALASGDVTIAENLPIGSAVATLVATDPDTGDTITYQITVDTSGGAFAIDPSTGQLTVADNTPLNFEASVPAPAFTVTVRATDANGLSASAPWVIRLSDVNEAPTALTLSPDSASAFSNRLVGQISATDEDIGETFTFTLLNDADGRFALDGNSGVLTTSGNLSSIAPSSGTFSIDVRVTDSAGNAIVRTLQVSLNPPADTGTAPPPTAPAPAPVGGPETIPFDPPVSTPPTSTTDELEPPPATPEEPLVNNPAAIDISITPLAPSENDETITTEVTRVRRQGNAAAPASPPPAIDPDLVITTELNESLSPFLLELFAIKRGNMDFQLPATDQDGPATPTDALEDFIRDPYKVSAAIVGSGAIWWGARAAGVLTTFLIGTPAWRAIDPVPILMRDRDQDENNLSEDSAPDSPERKIRQMFNQ